MRKLLQHLRVAVLLCIVTAAGKTAFCGTVLTPGDIAILGWNSDDTGPNQRWAFVTMVNLQTGTVINFTDNGYDGSTGQFRIGATNDGHLGWTVQSPIAAGTVIYATNTSVNGTTTGVSGQLGGTAGYFSKAGDQIIVYQGTLGTAVGATFIYAVNTGTSTVTYAAGNGTWQTSGTVTLDVQSYQPPGLTSLTSVALTANTSGVPSGNYGFNDYHYSGTTSGTKTQILTAMSNVSNWTGNDGTAYNFSSGSGLYPSNTFTVLPVTLVSFTAQLQGSESVQLKWSTAVETNNDHFTIERSTDGASFSSIGTVPGKVSSSLQTDYTFTDNSPEAGSNYYRLSQTDIDGHHQILGIKTVTVDEVPLKISPSVARDAVDATFTMGVWKEVRLYSGGVQLLQTISLANSIRRVHIQLGDYAPGAYYLSFVGTDRKRNVTKKFVKM